MSPFSVARAPHYVKEAELSHSFFRSAAYGKWEELVSRRRQNV